MNERAEPSREEVLLLGRLAGLDLPAAFEDDLVEAYAHVRALVARIPQRRARSDEPAHVFDPVRFRPDAP